MRERFLGSAVDIEVEVLRVPGASVRDPQARPALERERLRRDVPEEEVLDVVPLDRVEREPLPSGDRRQLQQGEPHAPPAPRLSMTFHPRMNPPRLRPAG